MQDKILVRIKDETGQFTKKLPEEMLIQKRFSIHPSQLEEIERRVGKGQKFSGFVRDAIAFYLEHQKTE